MLEMVALCWREELRKIRRKSFTEKSTVQQHLITQSISSPMSLLVRWSFTVQHFWSFTVKRSCSNTNTKLKTYQKPPTTKWEPRRRRRTDTEWEGELSVTHMFTGGGWEKDKDRKFIVKHDTQGYNPQN